MPRIKDKATSTSNGLVNVAKKRELCALVDSELVTQDESTKKRRMEEKSSARKNLSPKVEIRSRSPRRNSWREEIGKLKSWKEERKKRKALAEEKSKLKSIKKLKCEKTFGLVSENLFLVPESKSKKVMKVSNNLKKERPSSLPADVAKVESVVCLKKSRSLSEGGVKNTDFTPAKLSFRCSKEFPRKKSGVDCEKKVEVEVEVKPTEESEEGNSGLQPFNGESEESVIQSTTTETCKELSLAEGEEFPKTNSDTIEDSHSEVGTGTDDNALSRKFSLLELKMEVYTTRLKELEWEREQLRMEREAFKARIGSE